MEFSFVRDNLRYIYVTIATLPEGSLALFYYSQDVVIFGVKIRQETFLATRIT
jgi:hypothetical protein